MNAEERRLLIEETLEALNQRLNTLGLTNQDRTPQNRNHEDKSLRVDITDFTGQSLNPEDYLDWEASIENYFEYKGTPEDQQFKVAKVKLTKLAATWLEGIQRQRVREDKVKINSWEKLKKILRRKYVPSNYIQQLSMQWNTLSQGNKSVAQYIQEWEKLSVLCDIRDSEDMRVGKFLGGLREDLRMKVATVPHLTVALAGEQAILLEQYSKRRVSQSNNQPMTKTNLPMNEKSVHPTTSSPRAHADQKGKSITPLKDVVCFKCHGHGHFKVNCPNNRAFTLAEWDEIRSKEKPRTILVSINGREEERGTVTNEEDPDGTYIIKDSGEVTQYVSDSESDRELIYPEEGRTRALVTRKSLHSTSKQPKSDQRENIFQTKCKVKSTLCDLIIDGGSETNCVSQDLVKGLKLRTQAHPHPYQLKWVDNKASTPVSKQCLVALTIGSYQDQILCDVLDMSACHILLGRPWQYDKRVSHDGFTNTYTLRHEDKVKTLVPLPPHKAIPPSKNKQLMYLLNRESHVKEHCCVNENDPVLITPLIDMFELGRYNTNVPKQVNSTRTPVERVHYKANKGLDRQRQHKLGAAKWMHLGETRSSKKRRHQLSRSQSNKHAPKVKQTTACGCTHSFTTKELRTILFKGGEIAPNMGARPSNLDEPPWMNPRRWHKISKRATKVKGAAQPSLTRTSNQLTLLLLPRSTKRDPEPMKAGNGILGLESLCLNPETRCCITKTLQKPRVKVPQSADASEQNRTNLTSLVTSRPGRAWPEQRIQLDEPPGVKMESWHFNLSPKTLTQQVQPLQGH